MKLIEKLFGTESERELKKVQPLVDKILSYEEEYSKLSDIELQSKTDEFKNRIASGEEMDKVLPEAFATVREASWRVLGMKHFPVQLIGGIILHQGRIAEMATGEGKGLTATCPAYLNALSGKSVFVITVNDYLSKRDSIMMGKVYEFLGLKTGLIIHDMKTEERKAAYNCDIVYGTASEFGFDYLRDNMAKTSQSVIQGNLNYVIIDEVDSILIDEARTPLIISGYGDKSSKGYIKANDFVRTLKKAVIVDDEEVEIEEMNRLIEESDYIVEEKKKTAVLTANGIAKAEAFYGVENLAAPENQEINHYITRALKANGIFHKDTDYVVHDGKIVIVDEGTGRLMYGRRYNEGIHQAIEAKEGVDIQYESRTLASITYQNYFRKFNKLSGMTGTAKTEEEEFRTIYGMDVVTIPTNRPIQRVDKNDVVFMTRKGKLNAIVDQIKECHKIGQPILVGTVSVQKSEELSSLLKKAGIPHNILNAKHHEKEAQIIAQAGKFGAVTIATNMAGRGTDILLGGNPEYLALEELKAEGYSEELINEANRHSHTEDEDILNVRKVFKEKENRIKEELRPEAEKVKAVGGLYVLGSERHESRRIDNQLRGRSGRQGDVGVSEFILSAEDDLIRLFGGENFQRICRGINLPEDLPIDAKLITNQIVGCQKKVEAKHYQQRKGVLEYDEVVSAQRDMIYEERRKLLFDNLEYKQIIHNMITEVAKSTIEASLPDKKHISDNDIKFLIENFKSYNCPITITKNKYNDIYQECMDQVEKYFNKVYKSFAPIAFDNYARKLLLQLIDMNWQEQLVCIDDLKQGIGLRAYAQANPVEEFKRESFDMFYGMIEYMKGEVLINIMDMYNNVTTITGKIVLC